MTFAFALSSLVVAGLAASSPPTPTFEEALAAWKAKRFASLTSPTSWLTLVGLHWLAEGDNRVGSAAGNELPLAVERAPARVGVFTKIGTNVTWRPEPGVAVTVAGQPAAAGAALADADDGGPTLFELGSLDFFVVRRGGRLGLRVRDSEAPLRQRFEPLTYFPADLKWRVTARFVANSPGTTLEVVNVQGITEAVPNPGTLELELDGATHRLVALDDTGDGRLFLIVGDRTNGKETYGGGRFLYADKPEGGTTVVDFNRLYNPPCAFTPFSTCQLPPRGNKLPLRLEAGELKPGPGQSYAGE